jgi:hypothetical protein
VSSGTFAADAEAIGALADPVRLALYRFVVAQPEPVSRDQAASGVGIPRHQARFHLERLAAEGLLATSHARLTGRTGPGAGRPSTLYRRAPRAGFVPLPPRDSASSPSRSPSATTSSRAGCSATPSRRLPGPGSRCSTS